MDDVRGGNFQRDQRVAQKMNRQPVESFFSTRPMLLGQPIAYLAFMCLGVLGFIVFVLSLMGYPIKYEMHGNAGSAGLALAIFCVFIVGRVYFLESVLCLLVVFIVFAFTKGEIKYDPIRESLSQAAMSMGSSPSMIYYAQVPQPASLSTPKTCTWYNTAKGIKLNEAQAKWCADEVQKKNPEAKACECK